MIRDLYRLILPFHFFMKTSQWCKLVSINLDTSIVHLGKGLNFNVIPPYTILAFVLNVLVKSFS